MLFGKSWRHTSRDATLKQDLSSCAFCMIMLPPIRHAEKVNVPPHPPFSPNLAPCDYFLFPKLKFHLAVKTCKSRNALGSAVYQCLMGVPIQDYEQCFQIGLTA